MSGVDQVPVRRPLSWIRFKIAEYNDGLGYEFNSVCVILSGNDVAVLELFCKLIDVVHGLSLCTCDVEEDARGTSIKHVGHVRDWAAELYVAVVAEEVCELALSDASVRVVKPMDDSVVVILLDLVDEPSLPGSKRALEWCVLNSTLLGCLFEVRKLKPSSEVLGSDAFHSFLLVGYPHLVDVRSLAFGLLFHGCTCRPEDGSVDGSDEVASLWKLNVLFPTVNVLNVVGRGTFHRLPVAMRAELLALK